MRINKFLAQATGLSRRAADVVIAAGRVSVNGEPATAGYNVSEQDTVVYNGQSFSLAGLQASGTVTILLNKPAGYVVSRNGQGSPTVYDLLPPEYHQLKPVGRLDKNSSGLLLLTNDGSLANQLTHPSYSKLKIYEISLDKPLQPLHRQMISDHGLQLEDGPSRLELERLDEDNNQQWRVSMREGRNRQIRRTFAALDYQVVRLHRIQFGQYHLAELHTGAWQAVRPKAG